MDWEKRRRRKQEVKQRASHADSMYSYCRVIGCPNPARAGTGDGLDRRFCRKHYEYYQRHGSPYKGSYTAKELAPYRNKAMSWLEANANDIYVSNAIDRVRGLYGRAGPVVEAFRLRGLSPRERAWAAWARLRRAEVDPRKPVAAWLAVELAIANDPQPEHKSEYKRVQAAKLVHRMSSGTHKEWDQPIWSDGRTQRVELHVYPRSRGRVLRHIGEDIEGAVELLVDNRLRDLSKRL